MQAIVNYAPGKVETRDCKKPLMGEGEVLIKVKAVGVCGSDIHQWKGTVSYPVSYPVILGHEFGGIIEDVHPTVKHLKPGQRVACETSARVCGLCAYCRTGRYHMCPDRLGFGTMHNGAMTEYIVVREGIVHLVPDELSFEEAAQIEPAAVTFNGMLVNSNLIPGDSIAIIGPGPIGTMALQIAQLCSPSCSLFIGLRKDETRMNTGKMMGADKLVYSDEEDPVPIAKSIGDGLGVHTVFDTAGLSITQNQAFQMVRPGGTIIKIGWDSGALDHSLDPVIAKNARIQGTFSHNWATWERIIALSARGEIDLKSYVRTFPSERWEDAFEAMHSLSVTKSVLTF